MSILNFYHYADLSYRTVYGLYTLYRKCHIYIQMFLCFVLFSSLDCSISEIMVNIDIYWNITIQYCNLYLTILSLGAKTAKYFICNPSYIVSVYIQVISLKL